MKASRRTTVRESVYGQQGLRLPPVTRFRAQNIIESLTLSPIFWYDFADETKVTLSGSDITSITDKGSRGWTLTSSSTKPTYVTGINGRKCLDWGASGNHANYMRNTSTVPTQIGEVYVVVDASFAGNVGGSGYAGLFTGTGGTSYYMLASGTGMIESGTGFQILSINGSTNSFTAIFSPESSIDNPAIMRLRSSSGAVFTIGDGFQIGNDRSNFNLNRGWSGLIGEYIVFSSVLGTTDQNEVMAYLAAKWGITLI
jgi:hypothetical protein